MPNVPTTPSSSSTMSEPSSGNSSIGECDGCGGGRPARHQPSRLPSALQVPLASASPTRAPQRVGRDVPCTPLCSPSTSRPEAHCAQCACLAIHGERTQGALLTHGGRPPLARSARSPRSRFTHDHADRATLGCRRRPGGRNPEGRRTGSQPLCARNFEALPTAGRDACRYKGGPGRTPPVVGTLRTATTHEIPTTTQCRAGARRSTSQSAVPGAGRIRGR
jgi:hypothetical protein